MHIVLCAEQFLDLWLSLRIKSWQKNVRFCGSNITLLLWFVICSESAFPQIF